MKKPDNLFQEIMKETAVEAFKAGAQSAFEIMASLADECTAEEEIKLAWRELMVKAQKAVGDWEPEV